MSQFTGVGQEVGWQASGNKVIISLDITLMVFMVTEETLSHKLVCKRHERILAPANC